MTRWFSCEGTEEEPHDKTAWVSDGTYPCWVCGNNGTEDFAEW